VKDGQSGRYDGEDDETTTEADEAKENLGNSDAYFDSLTYSKGINE
jgi:hypothetical protein